MENRTRISVELAISAQKISQQMEFQNEAIETEIKAGIELAFNDMMDGGNFKELVRQSCHKQINDVIHKSILSWDVDQKIQRAITDAITDNIQEYAKDIAQKVIDQLK